MVKIIRNHCGRHAIGRSGLRTQRMWAIRQMTMQRFSGLLELDGWSKLLLSGIEGSNGMRLYQRRAAVKCEVFWHLLCVQSAEGRGLWPGAASLAMKDLHSDAPSSQRVGIWRWRVGKHVVWLRTVACSGAGAVCCVGFTTAFTVQI